MPEKVDFQGCLRVVPNMMIKIVTNPVGFYRDMRRDGGFVEPLIFMVCMGVVSGVIQSILAVFGIGFTGSFIIILASVIIMPALVVIFGFVGAFILFAVWKIMGSEETFETAYRCSAYASGISPVTAFLNVIPYLGPVLGLIWMTFLIVTASVEVHKLNRKTASIVFGIICLIFIVLSISSQRAVRKAQSDMESFQKNFSQGLEEMSPEEAGKAMGDFLKGLQDATEKN
jgi:hypothetical protein